MGLFSKLVKGWSFPSWLHESGKCGLTPALRRVWAGGGAVNSLSHSWRLAGTTPPVVNTLQGEGGGRGGAVGAGWGSLSYYQDLDCALGAQGVPMAAQQGWETFGIGPRGAEAQPSDLSQVLEHDWTQR